MTRECLGTIVGNDLKVEWGPVNDLDCLSTNISLSSEQAYIYTTISLDILYNETNRILENNNNNTFDFSPKMQRILVTTISNILGESSRDIIIESYKLNDDNTTIRITFRWILNVENTSNNLTTISTIIHTPYFQNKIQSQINCFNFSKLEIINRHIDYNNDDNNNSKTAIIVTYCVIFGLLFIILLSIYGVLKYMHKHKLLKGKDDKKK